MTLNEIAYNVLNLVRGGRSSHDEHISLEQIKFNIKHYRAMFIRRDFARNGIVTRHLEQDLGCLELRKANASKCCGLPSNCSVYKTVKNIPKTVRFNFKEAITYVGDITGTNTIPIVASSVIKWLPYDKYTKYKYKAYMIEDYMYIYNANGLQYINVRGIFENPSELINYDCDESECYNDDSEFPMPMDMISSVSAGLISSELQLLAGTYSDTLNDRMQDPKTIAGKTPSSPPAQTQQ